uniref:Macaca fascicularis brain cDNA clone: QtrA-10976, similar to human phosphofurin acidic cluster sorting protein 1 (PACS1), mRNA, RefSeq: NM_018026.2 n=1 Tax=Macaca fascicularis TaxID=9541 RepID=I7GHU5_MACFA|nr:unnamed protein product [Macaca fascicularis]
MRWALGWSMCPASRSGKWKRTWMNCMTVWRCTTPVTVALRWRRQKASSALQSPSSSLSLRGCRSPAPRRRLAASTARAASEKTPPALWNWLL